MFLNILSLTLFRDNRGAS